MRRGIPLSALALVIALSGCVSVGAAPSVPAPSATPAPVGATPGSEPSVTVPEASPEVPSQSPRTPKPAYAQLSPPADALLGTDGRWTVLVIGTDAREPLPGHRTDAMLVATINPITGDVAGASLPRDTAQVPIGPDRVFAGKINLLFQEFLNETGSEAAAAEGVRQALAYTFDVEIDNFVFLGFDGFMDAIDAIGGVDVTLTAPIDDPRFRNPDGTRGISLGVGVNHLDGQEALAFTRTRKLDTDYARSRRQQQLLAEIIKKVRTSGMLIVPALAQLVRNEMVTDISLTDAPALFELLGRADLDGRKSVVLGPLKWASAPIRFTNVLRIDVVREFFDRAYAAVK